MTRTATKPLTIRTVTDDGSQTFYVELTPQHIGAMGHEVEGAYKAKISLAGHRKGGLGIRAAIAMLADQAKKFANSTILVEDLPVHIEVLPPTSGTNDFNRRGDPENPITV